VHPNVGEGQYPYAGLMFMGREVMAFPLWYGLSTLFARKEPTPVAALEQHENLEQFPVRLSRIRRGQDSGSTRQRRSRLTTGQWRPTVM
jgi:hypothetical protein